MHYNLEVNSDVQVDKVLLCHHTSTPVLPELKDVQVDDAENVQEDASGFNSLFENVKETFQRVQIEYFSS